jgi:hypothetical protein
MPGSIIFARKCWAAAVFILKFHAITITIFHRTANPDNGLSKIVNSDCETLPYLAGMAQQDMHCIAAKLRMGHDGSAHCGRYA